MKNLTSKKLWEASRHTASIIWQSADSVLLICLVSVVFAGLKLEDAILVLTVLPLVLPHKISTNGKTLFRHLPFIVLCSLYSVFHLIKIVFWDSPVMDAELNRYPFVPEKWFLGLALVPVLTVRFVSMDRLVNIFQKIAPVVLLILFSIMSINFFTPYFEDTGRIKNLNPDPFISPLYFTIFTIMLFDNTYLKTDTQRLTRCALIVMSIILATAYAGTRGILLAQLVSYTVLACIFWASVDSKQKVSIQIVLSIAAGLALGFCIDLCAEGLFSQRFLYLFDVIQPIAESPEIRDRSTGIRSQLYDIGIEHVSKKPLFGYSIAYEPLLAAPMNHMHNMYISWCLWGGVFSLLAGMIFLLSPTIGLFLCDKKLSACVLGLSIIGPLSVSMLFDSFLFWERFYLLTTLVICFAYSLGANEEDTALDLPLNQKIESN